MDISIKPKMRDEWGGYRIEESQARNDDVLLKGALFLRHGNVVGPAVASENLSGGWLGMIAVKTLFRAWSTYQN